MTKKIKVIVKSKLYKKSDSKNIFNIIFEKDDFTNKLEVNLRKSRGVHSHIGQDNKLYTSELEFCFLRALIDNYEESILGAINSNKKQITMWEA
ncbi:hypothetical protein [Brassicibacter mesophilus]|uniref:hypothetical protein n=1 Tax=Brassicibacter mesophilus TaxID=745119 RepID=UPI003D2055DD